MPADSSDSTAAPDQSLTAEQSEGRAQTWARTYRVFRILLACGVLFAFGVGAFQVAFGSEDFERILPIVFGLFILYASLLLVPMTLLIRNRPNRLTALRSVRIVSIAVYVLFAAMIGLFLALFLWSLDIGVSAEAVMVVMIGFFILVVAFVIISIVAAFVALIEHGSRQQEAYRATHPRPS